MVKYVGFELFIISYHIWESTVFLLIIQGKKSYYNTNNCFCLKNTKNVVDKILKSLSFSLVSNYYYCNLYWQRI